jgi:hypothetical protein
LLECSGQWERTVSKLYDVFRDDFVRGRPRLRGKRVWWDRRVLPGERYEEGFWHLVSRFDVGSGERLLDFRRAERLCWCRAILDHADEPEITSWDSTVGAKVRAYLWLEAEDYVVVVEHRSPDVALLITAYCVDGDSGRRKLRRSHANRL